MERMEPSERTSPSVDTYKPGIRVAYSIGNGESSDPAAMIDTFCGKRDDS